MLLLVARSVAEGTRHKFAGDDGVGITTALWALTTVPRGA